MNVKSNSSYHCGKWNGSSFLERRRIGDAECRVCRAEHVLGIAIAWRPHDVECGNSVALDPTLWTKPAMLSPSLRLPMLNDDIFLANWVSD